MKTYKHISLEEIGTELPFSVPENYFDQFASQFAEQIGYKQSTVHRHIKPWMYMAATFVGVLMMSQVFYTVYHNNTIKNADNYETYVLSQVDETALIDCYVNESGK